MRRSKLKLRRRASGFTLVEAMVTISLTTLVGGMIFLVLNAGMNLYAKNTAVNAAHQQARSGVDQMLQNIHGAVSIPQLVGLVNGKFTAIADPGIGPASGISFQRFEKGPFPVMQNASASSTSLVIKSGTAAAYTPTANSRLNIPNHKIELDVISSSYLGSSQRRFNFASPIGTDVLISEAGDDDDDGGISYIVSAFATYRVTYAVIGDQLRYYPTNDVNTYKVIARNITSPEPFSIPILPGGGLRNRYVAAVNISTVEPQFTNRGYAAVNMFISSLIPFRSRLTNYQ